MEDKRQILAEIEHCEAIASLKSTKGWGYLQKYFEDVKQLILTTLATESNLENVLRLQEKYKAFNSMLETVENMGKLAQHLQNQLWEESEDEKFKSEYGLGN